MNSRSQQGCVFLQEIVGDAVQWHKQIKLVVEMSSISQVSFAFHSKNAFYFHDMDKIAPVRNWLFSGLLAEYFTAISLFGKI